ncbi:hypothetical protein GOODEAATRI_019640, partial [Goodea atripinnis]
VVWITTLDSLPSPSDRNPGPHLPAASASSKLILQPARSPTFTRSTPSDSPDCWPTGCAQDPPEINYQEIASPRTKTLRPETVFFERIKLFELTSVLE